MKKDNKKTKKILFTIAGLGLLGVGIIRLCQYFVNKDNFSFDLDED